MPDELKEYWDYVPETGEFFWIRPRRRIKVGWRAGCICQGYWMLCLKGQDYRAARVAWFFMTGREPRGVVDHKNGNGLDDRFANLREGGQSFNLANARWKTNTSGIKGVVFSQGKWVAHISRNKKQVHLGRYATAVEAARAYQEAAVEQWGEFAVFTTEAEVLALGGV